MGTNLINAIQHRNGPNQRPPNSIFGNSISNQKLISNHLLCGFYVAIVFYFAVLSFEYVKAIRFGSSESIVIIAFWILFMLVITIWFIYKCRRRKQQTAAERFPSSDPDIESVDLTLPGVANIENSPSCPDFEPENSVLAVESNVENPPCYDLAVVMPRSMKSPSYTLPPSYDKIDVV